MLKKLTSTLLFVFLATSAAWVSADSLPQPKGPIVLTVEGAISHTNNGAKAVFDRAMLEKLGMHVSKTSTPWTDGVATFEGPLGKALLEAVGAQGETLVVTALNDYSASVPREDFYKYDVVLAMKKDGHYLRVRDKGPLFIIYPFDSDPGLNTELIHNRSVWQIKSIRIE